MPNENLENLVKIRQLKAEPASKEEIAGLLRSGLARLEDSKKEELNKESRFDLAYNAAHALSLAALRAAGYRSENRYLVKLQIRVSVVRLMQAIPGLHPVGALRASKSAPGRFVIQVG